MPSVFVTRPIPKVW